MLLKIGARRGIAPVVGDGVEQIPGVVLVVIPVVVVLVVAPARAGRAPDEIEHRHDHEDCQADDQKRSLEGARFPALPLSVYGTAAAGGISVSQGDLASELLVQFVDGVGLVGSLIPDGPAAVGLVFIDHKLTAFVLKNAEGPGCLIVLPDEKRIFSRGMPLLWQKSLSSWMVVGFPVRPEVCGFGVSVTGLGFLAPQLGQFFSAAS